MKKNNDTPSIRFAGFTDAWEQRKLGELCQKTTGGGTPSTGVAEYWNGEIPWFQSSDFKEGIVSINSSNKHISQAGLQKSAAQLIPEQSIAIVARVGFGKLALIPFQYTTSQDVLSLSYLTVDSVYAVYSVYKKLQSELMAVQGTSIKGVTKDDLLTKDLNLSANREEQEKIGALFSNVDSLITLHQRKYDQLVNIKKSMLEKMFPKNGETVPEVRFAGFTDAWEQRKLGELGVVSMCKRIFKEQTTEEGEVPFYKIGTFGGAADAYISRELYDEFRAKYPYPQSGDILISASGSIGRTVEYTGNDEYFQDSNIVWLNHDERIANCFLKCFYQVVKWSGLEGSTIKRLYNETILNTEITLPSREEQEQIGSFFSNLDTLITLHQRKLERLQSIKKACLEKMFV